MVLFCIGLTRTELQSRGVIYVQIIEDVLSSGSNGGGKVGGGGGVRELQGDKMATDLSAEDMEVKRSRAAMLQMVSLKAFECPEY